MESLIHTGITTHKSFL